MDEKAEILSLIRDWDIDGGMVFASSLMLSFQGWRVRVAEQKWTQGLIYLMCYGQMSVNWPKSEWGGLVLYCWLSIKHGQNMLLFAWKYHLRWQLLVPPMWKEDDMLTGWSRPQGHNLLLMITSLLWMTRATVAFPLSFSVAVVKQ